MMDPLRHWAYAKRDAEAVEMFDSIMDEQMDEK